jgi:hypothetical protein
VYGNLPSANQLQEWEFAISQHSALPQGVLVSCSYIKLLCLFYLTGKSVNDILGFIISLANTLQSSLF